MIKPELTSVDYMQWESELSLQQVFADGESFAYPQFYQDGILYLTQLKHDQSRSVLIFKRGDTRFCITPAGFSLRTKVSEYGGKPFWLHGEQVYFANQSDQCLYCQTLGDLSAEQLPQPQRITPKPRTNSVLMYTDLVSLNDTTLAAIVEQENPSEPPAENISYIASIDLKDPDAPPKLLQSGADFYSNLVIDPKWQRIAWVQWRHPSMPWDDTQCWTARLQHSENGVLLESPIEIDLGAPACVCQLIFANNGHLFLSADFSSSAERDLKKLDAQENTNSDCWNVFCYEPDQSRVHRVTDKALEFGYPHWQYGDARIVQHGADKLLAIGSAPTGDRLFEIDQSTLMVSELDQPLATIQALASDGQDRVAMLRLSKATSPSLVTLNFKSDEERILLQNSVEFDSVSQAEHIEFIASNGAKAYGFYYPPANSAYTCEGAPPLIVLVHGGPTARAYGHFDIQKQFWTSRGFALFDVNHRGSTGYGRAYRDALYGRWGELDTADIIAGIARLVEQGKADSERVCIRGKSAGGYAVLRALTQYPTVFKAGACYYGIGNLTTLAQTTHKFEKYYTDRLIGESYDSDKALLPESQFHQRSPIHKLSQLKSAMIIFQGAQDNIVPPGVAREVVGVLKAAGLEHDYVEYPDEGHGFRQVDNNIDALSKELAFYQRVLTH